MTAAAYFAAWLAERANAGNTIVNQGDGWAVVEYRAGPPSGPSTTWRELVHLESPTSVRVERLGLLGELRFALGRR